MFLSTEGFLYIVQNTTLEVGIHFIFANGKKLQYSSKIHELSLYGESDSFSVFSLT